jgi:hypothetical protein
MQCKTTEVVCKECEGCGVDSFLSDVGGIGCWLGGVATSAVDGAGAGAGAG